MSQEKTLLRIAEILKGLPVSEATTIEKRIARCLMNIGLIETTSEAPYAELAYTTPKKETEHETR